MHAGRQDIPGSARNGYKCRNHVYNNNVVVMGCQDLFPPKRGNSTLNKFEMYPLVISKSD